MTKSSQHQLWTIVLAAAAGCALAGCSSSADKKPAATAQAEKSELKTADPFEAGAKMPPNTGTLFSLARILMNQGRDAEALTVLNNLTQRYPDYMPAYNAKAECHLRAERADEAIAALNAGLKRRPLDAVLLNNLGMVWFLEGRYEEALNHFDQAASIEPKEAMYAANQAMTLGMLGQEKQALALYQRVVDYGDARHNLRVLAKARAHSGARGAGETEETQRRTAWGEVRSADADAGRAANARATGAQ